MRAADLIKALQELDPESDVRVAQPTHDHWRRIVAADISINEPLEAVLIKHSAYHNADVVDSGSEDSEADYGKPENAVYIIGGGA